MIDVNGIHQVDVQFCNCIGMMECVEKYRQLLRVGWYPASFQRPKTAFTFEVLDLYHKLAIQGKLNLHDFYTSLLQKTDNCGQKKLLVSAVSLVARPSTDVRGCSIGITKCRVVSANGDT